MQQNITIARPYAKAAFEFAAKHQQIETWAQCLQLLAFAVQNEHVTPLLKNLSLHQSKILELFKELLGHHANSAIENFLHLLAQYRRLEVLPEVALLFNHARNDYEETLDVDIVSTYELTPIQEQHLELALSQRFKRKICLSSHIDPSLLGGCVIYAGDLTFDGSGKNQLKALKKWIET